MSSKEYRAEKQAYLDNLDIQVKRYMEFLQRGQNLPDNQTLDDYIVAWKPANPAEQRAYNALVTPWTSAFYPATTWRMMLNHLNKLNRENPAGAKLIWFPKPTEGDAPTTYAKLSPYFDNNIYLLSQIRGIGLSGLRILNEQFTNRINNTTNKETK